MWPSRPSAIVTATPQLLEARGERAVVVQVLLTDSRGHPDGETGQRRRVAGEVRRRRPRRGRSSGTASRGRRSGEGRTTRTGTADHRTPRVGRGGVREGERAEAGPEAHRRPDGRSHRPNAGEGLLDEDPRVRRGRGVGQVTVGRGEQQHPAAQGGGLPAQPAEVVAEPGQPAVLRTVVHDEEGEWVGAGAPRWGGQLACAPRSRRARWARGRVGRPTPGTGSRATTAVGSRGARGRTCHRRRRTPFAGWKGRAPSTRCRRRRGRAGGTRAGRPVVPGSSRPSARRRPVGTGGRHRSRGGGTRPTQAARRRTRARRR